MKKISPQLSFFYFTRQVLTPVVEASLHYGAGIVYQGEPKNRQSGGFLVE
jgi:hypothetical protein